MTEHWIDRRIREDKSINLLENKPRVSAETILKLIVLKNELLGTKKSVYEESLLAEDNNSNWV